MMMRKNSTLAGDQRKLPLLGVLAALAFGLPSAGLAVASLSDTDTSNAAAFEVFTPTSVDPDLAQRIAEKARSRGNPLYPHRRKRLTFGSYRDRRSAC